MKNNTLQTIKEFTEGKIDFEKLKLVLGEEIEKRNERYEFTWYGKTQAMKLAQTPSTGTLRPDKESSKNWDTTENLYIEGDNLEVLKLLQKSYFGKIKMIYIDPPYNTGKDFVYKDDFCDNIKNYKEMTHQTSQANTETNGRFHTDWLNMMYPRLKLARNLLREDGVIFISIDDNEAHNLRKICDEIFGEENLVEIFYIQVRYANKSLTEKDDFQKLIEQVLVYKKGSFVPNKPFEEYSLEKFKYKIIEKGQGRKEIIGGKEVTIFKPNEYEIIEVEPNIDGLKETWASGTVLTGNASGKYFDKYLSPRVEFDGLGILYKVEGIGEDGLGYRYFTGPKKEGATKGKFYSGVPLDKREQILKGEAVKTKPIINFYDFSGSFGNIRHEGGIDFRAGKKPVKFIRMFIDIATGKDDVILDFFGGSSSTAHAVIDANAEDNGNRKFIIVQLPEKIDENTDYKRAGFSYITDLGKERIRRAGDKIVEETGKTDLDIGFKVFKLDSFNVNNFQGSKSF
ncbi:site-specific DNA-methyltransferase [Bacillus smithii]|uniref:site-specific DNA-methyltransferase n=1 Tax=Bacillus smithii TaxID=1479 RepID=UPI002E1AC4CD|nr:site-specific DNA-methyltransferase [Bacillus smithii]MED4929182.1 site-specific DNA-methyltransferase [Bacillus smithii]